MLSRTRVWRVLIGSRFHTYTFTRVDSHFTRTSLVLFTSNVRYIERFTRETQHDAKRYDKCKDNVECHLGVIPGMVFLLTFKRVKHVTRVLRER